MTNLEFFNLHMEAWMFRGPVLSRICGINGQAYQELILASGPNRSKEHHPLRYTPATYCPGALDGLFFPYDSYEFQIRKVR